MRRAQPESLVFDKSECFKTRVDASSRTLQAWLYLGQVFLLWQAGEPTHAFDQPYSLND